MINVSNIQVSDLLLVVTLDEKVLQMQINLNLFHRFDDQAIVQLCVTISTGIPTDSFPLIVAIRF